MTDYAALDEEVQSCRKCEDLLARAFVAPTESAERVEPRPIVTGVRPRRIVVIGEAPGPEEHATGQPFEGKTGQQIRALMAEAGVPHFDRDVYRCTVVMCYPGHWKPPHSVAMKFRKNPPPEMIANCRSFFERQIDLANPRLIVTMGRSALSAVLQRQGPSAPKVDLVEVVGTILQCGGRSVVPLPAMAGRSFWLDDPAHQALFEKAKRLLRHEVIRL
jgi:uracil-DNA glycosylase family 4